MLDRCGPSNRKPATQVDRAQLQSQRTMDVAPGRKIHCKALKSLVWRKENDAGPLPFRRLTRLTFNYDGAAFPAASWHSYVGDLIARFAQARLAFYQGLNIPEFEQGWATRVAQIQTAAAKMSEASQVAMA
jgi:hypothetical protein